MIFCLCHGIYHIRRLFIFTGEISGSIGTVFDSNSLFQPSAGTDEKLTAPSIFILLIVNDAPLETVNELYESDNIQSLKKKKIYHISNVSVTLFAYQTLILKDEVAAQKTQKIHTSFEGKTIYPFLYQMETQDMEYVLKKSRNEEKEE